MYMVTATLREQSFLKIVRYVVKEVDLRYKITA